MQQFLVRFSAAVFVLVFFLRDANPLSSVIVLVLIMVAALFHILRENGFPNPANGNQRLRDIISSNNNWNRLMLLVVELLAIAIVAHFVINGVDTPFSYFRQFISCSLACYKMAYFP